MAINKVVYGTNTLIDLTADTVSANKMLDGTTAHDANGEPVTGNIPVKSSSDLTVSGATVNVPAGHFESPASKSIASGSVTVVTPTVNSSGLVTASANVSAGYVSGDPSPATLQLSTQGAQTITPGLTAQTISAGKYLTGAQTISAITKELLATLDPDFVAENIKKDVNLFGLLGTLESGGLTGVYFGTITPSENTKTLDFSSVSTAFNSCVILCKDASSNPRYKICTVTVSKEMGSTYSNNIVYLPGASSSSRSSIRNGVSISSGVLTVTETNPVFVSGQMLFYMLWDSGNSPFMVI